jgi:hypothetical protein
MMVFNAPRGSVQTVCILIDRFSYLKFGAGESPNSSIASDVDNLNNLALDKLSTKGTSSPSLNSQMGGAFIIPQKNRPNFNRILHYVSIFFVLF